LANLSAYLDFTILLDYTTGKVVLTDASAYPEGVAAGITGIVTVKQPDGIQVEGSWDTPNVIHNGTQLTKGEVELRGQADNTPQQGIYIVEYEVDHAAYAPTKVSKTFQLSYLRSEVKVTELFDVFTPNLSFLDDTDYNRSAFDAPVISRYWEVQAGTVDIVTGAAVALDLALNSNYYDAAYTASLTVSLTYQHTTYAYLTVKDSVFSDFTTTANTPPAFPTLLAYLKEIKQRFDSLESDVKTVAARQAYEYAESLLADIKSRICRGDTMNLYPQIQDFLNVYYDYTGTLYVNTNLPIAAYDYVGVDCGNDGGSLTDARITTQMIANWNTAYGSIPPDDILLEVGIDEDAPIAGTSTYTNNAMTGFRVRLYIGGLKLNSVRSINGDPYYTKVKASNTLTLTGMSWNTGDKIQIEHY
jgi:hypothetical protein